MKYLIFIFLNLVSFCASSQNETDSTTKKIIPKRVVEKIPINKLPNIKVAYTAIIPYPQFEKIYSGFKLGAEFNFRNRKVTKTCKSGKIKGQLKEHFISANFSGSGHPFFKRNVLFSAEWIKRTTYSHAFFWEKSAAIGMSRWFTSKVAYKRDADGKLTELKPQNKYLTINLLTGVGYDFMPKFNVPIKTYLKGGLSISQWNVFPYTNPLTELGVVIPLSFSAKK